MSTVRAGIDYHRAPELHATDMDGELVMMGREQGEYYGLRGVAAFIWTSLVEPRSLDELVVLVAAEYAVTPELCRADIVVFLDDLLRRALIAPAR